MYENSISYTINLCTECFHMESQFPDSFSTFHSACFPLAPYSIPSTVMCTKPTALRYPIEFRYKHPSYLIHPRITADWLCVLCVWRIPLFSTESALSIEFHFSEHYCQKLEQRWLTCMSICMYEYCFDLCSSDFVLETIKQNYTIQLRSAFEFM